MNPKTIVTENIPEHFAGRFEAKRIAGEPGHVIAFGVTDKADGSEWTQDFPSEHKPAKVVGKPEPAQIVTNTETGVRMSAQGIVDAGAAERIGDAVAKSAAKRK